MPRSNTPLDPITLEVIRNALPAISQEMSTDLQRTSYNMMIYEVQDFCTALLDTKGALISQNMGGVSHFVADLGVVIKDGIDRFGLDGFFPGDVIVHNHQRTAGQHLNNVVVYTPVFHQDVPVAFAVVRAHWADVGGLSTGFGGQGAYDPWSEGMQYDQIKIYEKGEPDRKVLQLIRDNIRYPDAAMGDLRSQLAACHLAERRFIELLDKYGRDTVLDAIDTIYAETEQKCRAAVARIPDGVYEAESFLDGEPGTPPYEIKVKVTVSGSDMEIDLSGCSPQRNSAMNGRTFAGAYIPYKALTAPMEPLNEGAFTALKVVIPEGNMMMATFPAFMANWSGALPTVVDTVWRAFAAALPDLIPAGHSGTLGGSFALSGYDPKRGTGFVAQSIEAGGWGGRPDRDGQDASMSVCQGDVRNTPIETVELKTPVMVLERGLRPDSGGPGKNRGGLGVRTRIRSLADGRWNTATPGRRMGCPPWGLWGGKDGGVGNTFLKRVDDDDFSPTDAPRYAGPAGTEVLYTTSGGGGWGNPLERDPERVLADIREGYVSAEAAKRDYGVVLTGDGRAVDAAATETLRAQMANGGA